MKKTKITTHQAAELLAQLGHKAKPRGKPGAPQLRPYQFKKGASANPGGKPKVMQKFAAAVAEQMMTQAPTEICDALKLERGASVYDAMVRALLIQAANGDTQAFTTVRETVEGKLPQRNYNLSMQMQAFMDDKGFQQFLEQQHGEYLKSIGGFDAARTTAEDLPTLLTSEGGDGGQTD